MRIGYMLSCFFENTQHPLLKQIVGEDSLEISEFGRSLALFCRRVTAISDALTEGFRQANRELDAVWRYGIAQTACLDVSRPCQTAR